MSTMPPTGRLDPSIEPRDQIHHINKISPDLECGTTVDAWTGLLASGKYGGKWCDLMHGICKQPF